MAQELFSHSLQEFTGEITNSKLAESIVELKRFLGAKKIKFFQWNEESIAVGITVTVDLPPLGNFQGIDIKDREYILIVINLKDYPTTVPLVYPDRLDFPKNSLAHLYVAVKGKPPAFCLVREGLTEWYSNKRLKDLYIRTANWLRDAACGELTEDGDQFDPIRLEGYSGSMIYDYDQLAEIVNEKKSFISGSNFSIGLFERSTSENKVSFKLTKIVTQETLTESLDDFKNEKEKSDSLSSKKHYHFGYIVWSSETISYNQYSVNFPEDWSELKTFCSEYGVSTVNIEKQIAEEDQNIFVTVPFIVAIRRPKKIIGFFADIEFVNFSLRVDTTDVDNGIITNNNAPTKFYKHAQPLSRQKAKEISGSQVNLGKYSLIVGCGALGSKIVMHFARSGATNYILTDPDDLSPHNMVRHALLGNAEGLNKAEALKKEITALYPYEKLPLLLSVKASGSGFIDPELSKFFSWILDFTASNAFAQSLILSALNRKQG